MKTKSYKWVVEIEVHPRWVADGFNLTEEALINMLSRRLDYAYESEYAAKVLEAPDPKQIRAEQGFQEEGYKPLFNED
jgi:hypothetical protein